MLVTYTGYTSCISLHHPFGNISHGRLYITQTISGCLTDLKFLYNL